MAKDSSKSDLAKAFHCDGYYEDGVCGNRGRIDYAHPKAHCFCNSYGTWGKGAETKLCGHCDEWRHKYFVKPKRKVTVDVKPVTPFHAKDEKTAITIGAFDTAEKLIEYLKEFPPGIIYGVDVRVGKLVHIPEE